LNQQDLKTKFSQLGLNAGLCENLRLWHWQSDALTID
jgi:hypothetical protein